MQCYAIYLTLQMDKVYNNTPGYVRTEVLNFT